MHPILKKYSHYIGIILSVALIWFLISWFSDIFTWLVLAWVISLLGSPLMKLMGRIKYKKWEIPTSLQALIVLSIFYAVLGLFIALIVPVIAQQGRNLAGVDYASVMESLEEPIAHINDWLVEKGLADGELSNFNSTDSLKSDIPITQDSLGVNVFKDSLFENVFTTTTINIDSIVISKGDTVTKTNINLNIALTLDEPTSSNAGIYDTTAIVDANDSPFEQLRKKIFQYVSPSQIITRTVYYLVSFFGNFMVVLTSVTFIAFFFLKDEKLFGRALKAAIPNKQTGKTDTALVKIKQLLTRYFSGILLQITLITLYVSLALSFFGVPNSFLIAFFAAIINVIPYLGPLIGALFALLVTISSNLDVDFYIVTMPMLFKVVGVFASMQLLDGFILQPYIFSNSVKAHPLEIFLVVVVGAKLGGITGMVVAIPIYTIIRVIAAVFLQEFKLVQKLTQSINDPDDGIPNPEENLDVGFEESPPK
ncbi:MAG: AI-2E family transporter [Saprospiraceae bacterium]|nr:AI-2E family transporter [Saprospiraceae bacterium]